MAGAEALGDDRTAELDELRAYLASVCPAVLGLEGEGERSAQAFRVALEAPDACTILST